MRFRLIPTDDTFFDLFCEATVNAADCADRLADLLSDLSSLDTHHAAVVACERKGDDITRQILRRLSTSFVTPFDREDIHELAEELDDAVDDMLAVAHRIHLTSPSDILPELKEQADVLGRVAHETVALMAKLPSMSGVSPNLDAIDALESEADAIYRRALGRLYSGEYEAIEVIKWKDVTEALEGAINALEDVSNVVESIVLKHA